MSHLLLMNGHTPLLTGLSDERSEVIAAIEHHAGELFVRLHDLRDIMEEEVADGDDGYELGLATFAAYKILTLARGW